MATKKQNINSMPTETLTPRERWLAVLTRQKPDRVPMDYWATSEASENLMKYPGCEDEQALFRHLHIDRIISVGPSYVGPPLPPDTDVFGCRYKGVNYGTGVYRECIYHPLAQYKTVEEIKRNYTWPDPDWWDYSEIPEQILGKRDGPLLLGQAIRPMWWRTSVPRRG